MYSLADFGEGSGYGILKVMSCSGAEERLVDCAIDKNGFFDSLCGHSKDVGIRCFSESAGSWVMVKNRLIS